MARGKTLLELKNALRAECRLSLNPAHNAQWDDHQTIALQRAQESAWDEFNWPHLRVERLVAVQAGQRYMAPPCDIRIDRVEELQFRYGIEWCNLVYGIEAPQYAAWDSETDQRSWPVARWKLHEDEQIEVWPIPSNNQDPTGSLDGTYKFIGIRNLRPLVADTDRADLDEWLIVLPAAIRWLEASGKADAPRVSKQLSSRLMRLRGQLVKRRSFSLFSSHQRGRPLQGPPRVQYRIETS